MSEHPPLPSFLHVARDQGAHLQANQVLRYQLCPPAPGVRLSFHKSSWLLNRSHGGLASWGPPVPCHLCVAFQRVPDGNCMSFRHIIPPKLMHCDGVSKARTCFLLFGQWAGSASDTSVTTSKLGRQTWGP